MQKEIFSKEQEKLLERIKQARLDAGLTQVQVAKKLKVYQSYISKVESGEIKVSAVLLKKLADIYNKNLEYFHK